MAPRKSNKIVSNPVSQPSLDSWISLPGSTKAKASASSSSFNAAASSSTSSSSSFHSTSLADLDAELITFSDALEEKDSVFLAASFPLHAPPSQSKLQTIFNKYLSPPRHPSLPAIFNREPGISPTHRMYAWRALGLKQGRNGTRGAGDFEIKEGSDDDGERWSADRILGVLRQREAVDTLVVCCRWYGGTQIGPIRFTLIEETVKQSLKAHLLLADVQPRKIELLARDARITHLRSLLPPPPPSTELSESSSSQPEHTPVKNPYEGLTIEKADRLLFAREKTIEGLEKKVKEVGGEAGKKDLKRRLEEVLDVEEEEEEEEEDGFARMERTLALKAKGKEKAPLPSFAKKKKVEVVVISDDDEEEAEEVAGGDVDDGGDEDEDQDEDEDERRDGDGGGVEEEEVEADARVEEAELDQAEEVDG